MENPTVEIAPLHAPVSIRWETENGYWRETRAPGASLLDLPESVQQEIAAHWSPEIVDQWSAEQAALAAASDVPPPVPDLTPRQLRLMLLQLNMSDADVTDSINLIPDAGERAAAMIEWNWATRYERDHPLVVQLSAALEFTPEQLDALWAYAADL